MPAHRNIEIMPADPRTPEIVAMIHALDRYMGALYPAESNHLVDVNTLAQPNVHFFAARVDGRIVGCGAIMVHGSDYAEVKRVFVDPAARGLGLGRRLIDKLLATARTHGVTLLRLETGISQPEALGLFEACGFARCGPFGDYPADDPYSVFMERGVA
ncbi:MAG: GNAT family N-acetyltransferase [Parvibaculaceae bacterium]